MAASYKMLMTNPLCLYSDIQKFEVWIMNVWRGKMKNLNLFQSVKHKKIYGGDGMIGLKRGLVVLCDHQSEWEKYATETIKKLWEIFRGTALDIQHIGSTAIHCIKAKPMLDIAVGVKSFGAITAIYPKLDENGVYKSSNQPLPGIVLCAIKDCRESDIVLCNLHIVVIGSKQWNNHIVFRDYMNAFPEKAAAYEKLKIELAQQYPTDREAYCNGKNEFINSCISEAHIMETFNQREDDLMTAERLLATERSRLLGTQGYSVEEFEKNMREAISCI